MTIDRIISLLYSPLAIFPCDFFVLLLNITISVLLINYGFRSGLMEERKIGNIEATTKNKFSVPQKGSE